MTDEEYREQEESDWEEILLAIVAFTGLSDKVVKTMDNDIRLWYSKYGSKGVMSYLESRKLIPNFHISRKKRLLRELNDSINNYGKAQQEAFTELIKTILPDFPEDKILKLDWAVDGKTFLDRIADDKAELKLWVEQELNNNLIKQSSAEQLINKLNKKFNSLDKRVGTRFKTEALARVAKHNHDLYKADGVSKYIYKAVMDDRTSEICKSMNGRIFYVSEYVIGLTAPPLHPNCRSYTLPYVGMGKVGNKA